MSPSPDLDALGERTESTCLVRRIRSLEHNRHRVYHSGLRKTTLLLLLLTALYALGAGLVFANLLESHEPRADPSIDRALVWWACVFTGGPVPFLEATSLALFLWTPSWKVGGGWSEKWRYEQVGAWAGWADPQDLTTMAWMADVPLYLFAAIFSALSVCTVAFGSVWAIGVLLYIGRVDLLGLLLVEMVAFWASWKLCLFGFRKLSTIPTIRWSWFLVGRWEDLDVDNLNTGSGLTL